MRRLPEIVFGAAMLVDASSDAAFQELISVYDALLAGGATRVLFTGSAKSRWGGPLKPIKSIRLRNEPIRDLPPTVQVLDSSYLPGVRVNGVPIEKALAGPLPPRCPGDPALTRILEVR